MKNVTGPPVEGEDFFGREKELQYVWKRICDGNNQIFPSPRRVGKTSFALKLLDKAKNEGWNTIHINLEEIVNEQKFVEIFIDKLKDQDWWEGVKEKGKSLIDFIKPAKTSVEFAGAKMDLEWKSKKEDAYKQLSDLLNHGENTLIFFDELTVLLTSIIEGDADGKKNVTNFLHWLRHIRINPKSKIRWIYCSSVGIQNFTHTYGISDTLNDIHEYSLKSYTKEESKEMLKNLGDTNGLGLEEALLNTIVDKLDYCLPFFLQIIFEKIHYLVTIENLELNNSIVAIAYNALLEEAHFNTWIERIDQQYFDNKSSALVILKHICAEKTGTKRESLINAILATGLDNVKAEELISKLLYMLKNDGYLIEENSLYRFRSPLLRDFWFNRFIK